MTLIADKIVEALKRGKSRVVGNTRTDGRDVWLHGNLILWTNGRGVPVAASLAGWPTITTRSRLNDLLAGLGYPRWRFSISSRYGHRLWAPKRSRAVGVFEKVWLPHADSRRGGLTSAQLMRLET